MQTLRVLFWTFVILFIVIIINYAYNKIEARILCRKLKFNSNRCTCIECGSKWRQEQIKEAKEMISGDIVPLCPKCGAFMTIY